MLPHLLEGLRVPRTCAGRPRTRPDALLADKAYCAREHRLKLTARGIKVVIPERDDQIRHRKNRGSTGGRPPTLDTELYKRRNVVERSFNVNKQWRGLATRYDKHAITYRAGVVLSAVITWLKALLGDMP
jgi:putative transposase